MILKRTVAASFLPSSKGFTLMEALVSLVIVGMIAAVTVPYIPRVINSIQLKAATRELAYSLRAARSNAIARQHESVVNLDLENARYWSEKLDRAKSLPSDVHIALTTARSERVANYVGAIRFFPDGSSTGGQITIKNGISNYTIDVSWLNGRVRILDTSF